jgi:poly(3-hydroxybutyrate) depolymerase
VRALLPGHDVYITDWTDARLVPLAEGYFHFADYVAYVQEFMRLLAPDVHVISVCQPTVPVLAAVSLMAAEEDPARPRSMTLMGGPIDTRAAPTEVNRYAKTRSLRWFDTHVITRVPLKYPGYMRRVYPGFLQHSGFVAMNPDRHLQAHLEFYNHLVEGDGDSAEAHRKFYDEYNAVMDLPAEYYLETLEMVFMQHRLPQGEMTVFGQRVRPEAIRDTALFTIEGELDDISGPGQTEAAHGLCSGIPAQRKEHFLVPGVGHYGIFSGRRWRETICPRVRDFIRRSA